MIEQRSRKEEYIRTEEGITTGKMQGLMAEKDGGGEAAE